MGQGGKAFKVMDGEIARRGEEHIEQSESKLVPLSKGDRNEVARGFN